MGALGTLTDPEIRDATEADVVAGVTPRLVARPTSTEEVSTVLRAAAEDGLTVVPRGAGTAMGLAPPPRSCDVVLDLSAMNQVLEHQSGDLIAAAEAGTPIAHLQKAIAGSGQRLALDEVIPGTTVGGLIATNLSGPRRMAYGTVRDLLIGVTVVRADGVVAKAGGKVVKNVAGYDLGKLMIGSYGTLAVITSAYFRLHPIPQTARWVTTTRDSPQAAAGVIHDAVHSQVVPAAVEVESAPGSPTTVSVLVEGTTVGVEGRIGRVLQLCGPEATVSEQGPPVSHPGRTDETLLKLTCQLSAVPQVAQSAADLGLHVRGSAGTGVLYAAVPDPAQLPHAVARLRAETAAAGGSAVVLRAAQARHGGLETASPSGSAYSTTGGSTHGDFETASPSGSAHSTTGGSPTDIDAWGPVPGLDLMRAVKDRFDPEHRLSPGRFVGGI